MLHMNKKHGIWDRIFQNMLSGAKSSEIGCESHAYFCFGMAAGQMIEGANVTAAEQLGRMSKLRESLLGVRSA